MLKLKFHHLGSMTDSERDLVGGEWFFEYIYSFVKGKGIENMKRKMKNKGDKNKKN